MLRIKKILSLFIVFLSLSIGFAIAQPNACVTLPSGVKAGGDFDISLINGTPLPNGITCLPSLTSSQTIKVDNKLDATIGAVTNPFYVFDVPQTVSYSSVISGLSNTNSQSLTAGKHWILQSVQVSGTTYIKCKEVNIIQSNQPKVNIALCGSSSGFVEIANDPINNHTDYTIDWGDGTVDNINMASLTLPIQKVHIYNSSPLPSVNVEGKYSFNGTNQCPNPPITKPLSPISTPSIIQLESGNTDATITFTNHTIGYDYDLMVQESGSTNWIRVASAKNGFATANSLKPNTRYCFKIATTDPCGNPIASNDVCSILLKGNVISSTDADFNWNYPTSPLGAPNSVELIKETLNPVSSNSIPMASGVIAYHDNALVCSYTYNYHIKMSYNLAGTPVTILSNPVPITPSTAGSTIPSNVLIVDYDQSATNTIKVTVNMNSVNGGTLPPKYYFYRTDAGKNDFQPVGTSTTNSILDNTIPDTKKQYCYKYKFENTCGVLSNFSAEYCTILLSQKNESTLKWTQYTVTTNPVKQIRYVIFLKSPTGTTTQVGLTISEEFSIDNLLNTATEPKLEFIVFGTELVTIGSLTYPISANSNTITVLVPIRIYFPTAFTPNSDGSNDVFEPTYNPNIISSSDMSMQIYDRWGGVVFDSNSTGKLEWNGFINGEAAPTGPYAYKLFGKNILGEPFTRSGTVMLLR